METKELVDKEIKYRDFPPTYDDFRKQKVQRNVESAVEMILRVLYGPKNLMPNIKDLFFDIERHKHMLDTELNVMSFKRNISELIRYCVPKMKPEVEVSLDRYTQTMDITIFLFDDKVYAIKLENAHDYAKLDILLDKKKFYE